MILATFEILFGVIGFAAGAVIIGLPALASMLPRIGTLLNSLGLMIGLGLLFFGLVWLATGIGFLRGASWSRTLGLTFNVISILGAVGALISGLVTGGVGAIIFWSFMMYYLTRAHVKVFFGKGASGIVSSLHLPYPAMTPVTGQKNATIQTGNGSNHPPMAGLQLPKLVVSCPNCGSKLTVGSPKCLICGAAI